MVKRSLPKFVYAFGNKGYLYFRDPATRALTRMPDDPTSAEFASAYARLRSGRAIPEGKRSVKKLIASYLASPKWEKLAKNTRKSYLRSFRYFEEKIGHFDPASLRRAHIIEMRDALSKTPTTANRRVAALSTLLEHGIDIDWIGQNPAKGISSLEGKRDPRRPWPPELIATARETAQAETLLLFEMLLGTGQRIGDVLTMQWGHMEDGGIWVIPAKTKRKRKRLYVPLTDRLRAMLDATPRRGLFIVTLPDGKPMAYNTAWRRIMDLRQAIGAEGYDIHSLRHAAASEIAAIPGMTSEHVQAITGHSSADMVRLYAGAAQQKARAQEAQKGRK